MKKLFSKRKQETPAKAAAQNEANTFVADKSNRYLTSKPKLPKEKNVAEIDELYLKILDDYRPKPEVRKALLMNNTKEKYEFIKKRYDYYATLPTPESVVTNFSEHLSENFLQMVNEAAQQGPLEWYSRFLNANGAITVIHTLQSLVNTFPKLRPLYVPNIKVFWKLMALSITIFQSKEGPEKVIKDKIKSAVSLFVSLIHVVEHTTTRQALEILYYIIKNSGNGEIVFEMIEKIEHDRSISDIFKILRDHTNDTNLTVFTNTLLNFLCALCESIKTNEAISTKLAQRLCYAGFKTTFTNLNKNAKSPNIDYLLEFITKHESIFGEMIGSMLVSPDRIEESYIALLPPMELNNRFKRVDDLLNFKQQQQQQQQQPRNAASMHRLPRLFLELAWLIGNKWERKFINIGQILDVMRAARFINQCLPQTQLYEVMRRAASIVQAREGKYLVLEEKTDASKEWKKEANFFGGNDFLVACALQFAQSGFINSKEISMMSCQTLFVVLENCAKLITMNKDKFQQYLREEGDEYVPGDSCIPDSVIDTSASNAPVADSPISVPPPPSGDTPDISGLAPPPPPPPPPDMDGVPSPPGMDGVPPPPPPPPPPPGMDGVPPPPPPPPPPPGMEGVPPPPGCPPPPPKPAGPPKKPNPAPPEKVRAIFWTKIPDVQATKTLWMQIDDSKVKLNTDNLMRIFRAAGTPAKVVRKVADPETQVQKTEEKVTLLSGDSAKSVSIMLNRFKLPPQKIVELVKNLDPSLQEDHIAAIASNMPKPDELAPFKDFSGNISQLTPPDLYFKAIADFPLFQASMEILQLRLSANSEVDEHIATLENVIKACKQVKTSKSFQFILVLILRIGNILNGGGNRGGAYGFKLSTLPKVANARAAMPGETLMSYIVNYIENKHPEMVNLSSDLNMIPAAQKADLRSIRQDLMPLKGRIESVSKAQNDGSDRFKQAAAALVRDVGSNIETALNLLNQAEQEVKNLMTTYYEDQDTSPSDFFDYILTFLNDFDAAREAIAKKKAEEEKAKREASGRPTGRKNAPINIGNQQRGLMDDLFAQIKSGKLKRVE